MLTGGSGSDRFDAGAGNDTVNADADDIAGGIHSLQGGSGEDTLSFASETEDLSVMLDDSHGFEVVQGGQGEDHIRYTGNNSVSIHGGIGDDHIEGGNGSDQLDGGSGNDTVSYQHSYEGVNVDLQNGTAQTDSGVIDQITNFENIADSQFDDLLIG